MKNKKNANTVVALLIVTILAIVIYFLIPNSFWDNVGSKNFNSSNHVGSSRAITDTSTPTSLQFKTPFEYDKYQPTKKDEFIKKREENKKKSERKSFYWK